MFVFVSKRKLFRCLVVGFIGSIIGNVAYGSVVFDDSRPPLYKVRGEYFIITWDASRGGEIMLRDTEDRWNKINTSQRREDYDCLPRLVLSDDANEYYLAEADTAAFELITNTSEKIAFKFTAKPKTSNGYVASWIVTQKFTVYAEGALFADLELQKLLSNTPDDKIAYVTLGMSLDADSFRNFRWFWKQDPIRGDEFLTKHDKLVDTYARSTGATFSKAHGFSNHIEMFVEEKKSFLPRVTKLPTTDISYSPEICMAYTWHLYDGPPHKVKIPFAYKNRWGLCFGRMRQNDPTVGQRIAHWVEGGPTLINFPSNETIDGLAQAGVTINIVHLYWVKDGWSGAYIPIDETEMKRRVANCHKKGIKAVVYAIPKGKPGYEGVNSIWFDKYNLDGLYFDYGTVHFNNLRGVLPKFPHDFPALDFFLLTRHYREVVGTDGILISHAGPAAPDALFHLNFNAYLSGEAFRQVGLTEEILEALYRSGQAYSISHPWTEYSYFRTQKAVARYAAIGGFPHILIGRGTSGTTKETYNEYDRCIWIAGKWAMVYWTILRSIPMEAKVTMYNLNTKQVVLSTNPNFYTTVYHHDPNLVLVITSNLGPPGSSILKLDFNTLNMAGSYDVKELAGDSIEAFRVIHRPASNDGIIETGEVPQNGIHGYFFVKPPYPSYIREYLESVVPQVVGTYKDTKPPEVVTNLTAKSDEAQIILN